MFLLVEEFVNALQKRIVLLGGYGGFGCIIGRGCGGVFISFFILILYFKTTHGSRLN